MSNDDTDADAEADDDLPASAAVPSRPIGGMKPRERAEELFDVVLELFNRCFTLCGWAGVVADDYLRIEHTIQSVGRDGYDFDPRFFLMELVMNSMSNWQAFDAWLARAKELLPTLRDELNAASSGPVKIGPVLGSTAHEAAIVLCDHMKKIYRAHGTEQLPMKPALDEPYTVQQLLAALGQWRKAAQRYQWRLLEVVGGPDYATNFEHWMKQAEIEYAKILKAMPAEPELSYEERKIVDALKKAGKPLRQTALLIAAGLNPDNGTHKSILAQMRQRGSIDHKGKGYKLPG